MPQNINLTTSFMTELFSDMDNIKTSTGFLSVFGQNGRTEYVDNARELTIDIIRGEKKISKLLQRVPGSGEANIGSNVTNTTAQKFQNASRVFPLIQERGSVSYDDTLDRVAGEIPINSGMLSISRAREKFGEIVMTNFKKMAGRMELEASESLRTGIITFDDGGTYNFDRATTNTIVPAVLWSVVATADPMGNIDDLADSIQENGKTEGMACVMGTSAFSSFLDTDQIKNIADNRRLNFVQAGDSKELPGLPSDMQYMLNNGFKYMAYMTTEKGRTIYIFTYNEKYQNTGGTWVEYMPLKDVLLFDHTARYDRYFGPRIRFDLETENERVMNRLLGLDGIRNQVLDTSIPSGVIDARMFHHDGFLGDNKTVITIESYTGPIYAPTHVDAAGLLDGVIA